MEFGSPFIPLCSWIYLYDWLTGGIWVTVIKSLPPLYFYTVLLELNIIYQYDQASHTFCTWIEVLILTGECKYVRCKFVQWKYVRCKFVCGNMSSGNLSAGKKSDVNLSDGNMSPNQVFHMYHSFRDLQKCPDSVGAMQPGRIFMTSHSNKYGVMMTPLC